ncbi:MAG: hypothetical protein ABR592_06375 [Nitriliruptorales bacterium]
MSFTTAAVLVAWIAIALLAFVVSHLVRQVSLLAGWGGQRPLAKARLMPPPQEVLRQVVDPARRFALVLVVGESCGTCHRILPTYLELARSHSQGDASFSLAALGDGRSLVGLGHDLPVLPHAERWTEAIGISVTPYLLIVDRVRNETSGRAVGSTEALRDAVTSALALQEITG